MSALLEAIAAEKAAEAARHERAMGLLWELERQAAEYLGAEAPPEPGGASSAVPAPREPRAKPSAVDFGAEPHNPEETSAA